MQSCQVRGTKSSPEADVAATENDHVAGVKLGWGESSGVMNLARHNLSIANLKQMSNLPDRSFISVLSSLNKLPKSSISKILVKPEIPDQDMGVETNDLIDNQYLMPHFVKATAKNG